MSPDELMEVAERVLAMAAPEEQVEVVAAHSRDTEVRAYDGEIEAFTSAESAGFGVRVIRGHRQGFAYAGTLDADVVAETLGEARDNAAFSTVDEFTGLVEPDGVAEATLHLYDEALAGLGPDRKIELALELERLVCAGDPRILGVEMAEYADSIETAVIASTTGIRSISRETGCSLAAYSLAGVDDDVTTGFGFSVGRGLDDLDLEDTARQAVERAVRMLGAGRAPSRRLTVVFDPWVTAQFLSIVGESFSGSEVLKGRSFLADRVGASIAPPTVTLVDDPTDGRWPSATPSDAEGLATRRNVLIDAGVVSGFVHDGYSARALGARSTGSAVRHGFKSTPGAGTQSISLLAGDHDPASILAAVGDGIYISDVQGLHSGVNPVSGDFSTGIEGMVIRGGELAEAVKEVTIASTLQRMMADISMVGSDLTAMPLDATGVTLAIADVTLSGS